MDLGDAFRHIASVEEYWRRVILGLERAQEKIDERSSGLEREISRRTCPDPAALRAILTSVFAATERLLDEAELDALAAKPVATNYPVANALEALSLCHLHTVHHRAQIVSMLRALGVDPRDWV
jgi:uncharacterized damage-inducible protein DinB